MKLLLRNLQDIQNTQRLNTLLNRKHVEEVKIDLDLDPGQKRTIEIKIQELFNECGCAWGAIGLFISFFSSLLIFSLTSAFQWKLLLWSLGISIISSALSKAAGLLRSYIKLANVLTKLENIEQYKSIIKTGNHGTTL